MNFKYWGGANSSAPIFSYLGAEGDLDSEMHVIRFLTDNAYQFKSLLVYIKVIIITIELLNYINIDIKMNIYS